MAAEDEAAEVNPGLMVEEQDVMEAAGNAANLRLREMMRKAREGTPSATPTPTTEKKLGDVVPVLEQPKEEAPPASPKVKRVRKTVEEGRVKRVKSSSGGTPTVAQQQESREPPKGVGLSDLGGIEGIIESLLEFVVMPLRHPEIYEFTGVPLPRGVLLHGPPGCGKTYLANALAGELGMPFISVSAPSIVSGMSGESEKKVRELFEEAREKAPCLVFLDEIDAITPKRESAQREMERRIVAQLLTCLDELRPERNEGRPVMVIGATNRPDSLDPALRRAGRFEKEICLTVPDEEAREK